MISIYESGVFDAIASYGELSRRAILMHQSGGRHIKMKSKTPNQKKLQKKARKLHRKSKR